MLYRYGLSVDTQTESPLDQQVYYLFPGTKMSKVTTGIDEETLHQGKMAQKAFKVHIGKTGHVITLFASFRHVQEGPPCLVKLGPD